MRLVPNRLSPGRKPPKKSMVGGLVGMKTRPRSGSADIGAHDETSPVRRQASFFQVSWPNSPGRGMTWNFHSGLPVRAS